MRFVKPMKDWLKWNETWYVYQVRYAKSKYGHEIRQLLSANKLCMRFLKPMKEWLIWDETWYVYQVMYAKSKYGHKIRQWLSANKLCMRFVKQTCYEGNMVIKLDSLKWDCQTWYVYQVRYAKSKYGHKISQWLSANKLCMRFVKPMKEWWKWD